MDSKKLLDMILGFVMDECKGEDGKVDVDEAVEVLGDLLHDLAIHMTKIAVFNEIGKLIDETDGNVIISAMPIPEDQDEPCEPGYRFSDFLENQSYSLTDVDGDPVSDDELVSLIDEYAERMKTPSS